MSKHNEENFWTRLGYSADWLKITDRIRFGRAAGRCECRGECGRTHGKRIGSKARCKAVHGKVDPITGQAISLQTAHLNHDKSDNDDGNLRAFCSRCHALYDAPEKRRRHYERLRAGKAVKDLFDNERS